MGGGGRKKNTQTVAAALQGLGSALQHQKENICPIKHTTQACIWHLSLPFDPHLHVASTTIFLPSQEELPPLQGTGSLPGLQEEKKATLPSHFGRHAWEAHCLPCHAYHHLLPSLPAAGLLPRLARRESWKHGMAFVVCATNMFLQHHLSSMSLSFSLMYISESLYACALPLPHPQSGKKGKTWAMAGGWAGRHPDPGAGMRLGGGIPLLFLLPLPRNFLPSPSFFLHSISGAWVGVSFPAALSIHLGHTAGCSHRE